MKNYIEKINELKEKPYGKAVLFFGFYFVFFLIIFIVARVGTRNTTVFSDYEKGKKNDVSVDYLQNNNYKYVYTVILDDNKYVYIGQRYNNIEIFEYNNQKYYFDGVNYYIYGNSTIVDNPYNYSDFLKYDKLFNLLDLSYYESATNYENGKVTYNFLVSTNTINKEFYNLDTDFDEVPNTLRVGADEQKNIDSFEINLDSYCVLNKLCNKNLRIELVYSDFGKVEELSNS